MDREIEKQEAEFLEINKEDKAKIYEERSMVNSIRATHCQKYITQRLEDAYRKDGETMQPIKTGDFVEELGRNLYKFGETDEKIDKTTRKQRVSGLLSTYTRPVLSLKGMLLISLNKNGYAISTGNSALDQIIKISINKITIPKVYGFYFRQVMKNQGEALDKNRIDLIKNYLKFSQDGVELYKKYVLDNLNEEQFNIYNKAMKASEKHDFYKAPDIIVDEEESDASLDY